MVGWKETITCCYYSFLYKMYISTLTLEDYFMQTMHNQCPTLALSHKIGLWNTILLIVASFYSSIIPLTPNESISGEDNNYIPKWKRRRNKYISKGKSIVNKLFNNVSDFIESTINNLETRRELRASTASNYKRYNTLKCAAARRSQRSSTARYKSVMLAFAAIAMSTEVNATKHGAKTVRFDTDSKTIGVDNRCSACISYDEKDFISDLRPSMRSIKGFGGIRHNGTVMTGTIQWEWCDDLGKAHKFTIPNSYYVPEGKVRLLSPQHWAQTQKDRTAGTGETTNAKECVLYWNGNENKLTIPLHKNTNIATFAMAPGYAEYDIYCQEVGITTRFDDENIIRDPTVPMVSDDEDDKPSSSTDTQSGSDTRPGSDEQQTKDWTPTSPHNCEFDLNGPRRDATPSSVPSGEPRHETMSRTMQDLMRVHTKMNHIPFEKIKEMARQGALPKEYAKCDTPVCNSCMYAKMTKRQWRHKQSHNHTPKVPPKPGEVISVDQMVSSTHGLVAQMTGILTTARYKYATVYVDQGSRLGYTYLQRTATAEETIKGKIAFELYARSHGITVKAYHADNGIFRANKWVEHCLKNNQALTFAGVNAHHQNGIAERRIRELQELARTMLIHAARRWPACITANLWPYAVRMANDAFNHSPNLKDSTKRSPIQIFGNTKVATNPKHFQPFGCPVFILDNNLQHNAPFHKWKERSRVGIYLGKSPAHSNNVALVLDRTTGLVSPQFHIKFDPSFHSVMQDDFDSQWQHRAGFIKQEPQTKPKATAKAKPRKGKQTRPRKERDEGATTPNIPATEQEVPQSSNRAFTSTPQQEGVPSAQSETEQQIGEQYTPAKRNGEMLQQQSKHQASSANNTRKRLKTSKPRRRVTTIINDDSKTRGGSDGLATPDVIADNDNQTYQRPHLIAMATEVSQVTRDDIEGEILCLEAMFPDHVQEHNMIRMEQDPLYAYKATSDPDTMYMHEAMREKDAEQFKAAMVKEVKDQMDGKVFSLVPKSQVPKDKVILPAVWQMRRKRDIKTKEVKKYKARLNIDGSKMIKGEHYDQTYAPVASWKFIRLLLTLVAKYNWHSRQLDYVLAFPQAPVEREIYMQIPKGFKLDLPEGGENHVLKIHRNIYGQKQAGRVWFHYLRDKLVNELKFKQSKVDECVFYRGKTLYVLYTDDSLLAGPDNEEIEQIIKDLKRAKLDITDEGDIQDFLGVNIDMKADGTIHLTQPHLIDQILKDLKFPEDRKVTEKQTPSKSSEILKRDIDGVDFDGSFHYRSIIGKLNYLEKATRSDIAYITHQCARFAENPKQSHAKAIRWMAKYLKTTRDKGTILKPIKNRGLEVYVDADFSGNWDPKAPHLDRDTARSRHGYIVMYEGCPMIHKSQLQTEIALSSCESEYIGISYALREVIPIMELLREMKANGFPIFKTKPKIHCKVFEDNSGALEMAKNHKFRPRTKHLNVKLHHFRDYVTRGEISLHKIESKEQLADFLTKPVTLEILQYLRPKVMGW